MPGKGSRGSGPRRVEKSNPAQSVASGAAEVRVRRILDLLDREYPDIRLALDFEEPLDLLISLILAAQCTDVRVNLVMSGLRNKYRTAQAWATVDRATLEEEIRSTGFFRNKAKAIQGATAALVERFGGDVPDRLDDLVSLPGVGRKTANILRGNAFGHAAIGVDTHVGRLARRLGLSEHTDPDKVEADLSAIVPAEDQVRFCQLVQNHGRVVCTSRQPQCDACAIVEECPRVGVV